MHEMGGSQDKEPQTTHVSNMHTKPTIVSRSDTFSYMPFCSHVTNVQLWPTVLGWHPHPLHTLGMLSIALVPS